MNIDLGRRASQARNTVLAGTSTALDVLYEITGRRVKALQRGAALLYDMSCEGVNLDIAAPDETTPTPVAAPAPTTADAPAVVHAAAAAPEPPSAPADEAAPEPEVIAAPAPAAAPEPEAVEAAEAAQAPTEAEPEQAAAARVPPVEGYDDLTVKQALEALEGLGLDALREVLAYEEQTRARITLIRAIKKKLDA